MNRLFQVGSTGSAAVACIIAALALGSCSKEPSGEPTPAAEATTAAPEPAVPATAAPSVQADSGRDIPAAARGRWGLVPADCTSTRGDAKGLLIVDATTLKFYESLARLGEIKERDANRIRAAFSFSGEGQEWALDVLLDVQDGGKTLVRRDYGPDAMPGPLQYTRCGDDKAA